MSKNALNHHSESLYILVKIYTILYFYSAAIRTKQLHASPSRYVRRRNYQLGRPHNHPFGVGRRASNTNFHQHSTDTNLHQHHPSSKRLANAHGRQRDPTHPAARSRDVQRPERAGNHGSSQIHRRSRLQSP